MIIGLDKCDIINDIKLFPTVNHRIYCRKILTLSNQTLFYKSKLYLVSNEVVNTSNHTVTMLIFSVFCFPMITDDKKPGYKVAFYTCKQKLMFCEYIWNFQMS